MLRGLDASTAARSDHQPPVVRVADRAPLPVTVTVYVHERPSPDCQRRFERVLDHLELLDDVDLVRGVRAVALPSRVEAPDGEGAVRALVGSFVAAAGDGAVSPFFDRGPECVSVPDLAVVLRRGGTITDLYPRRTPDGVLSVDDGLERLVTGEALEGLVGNGPDRRGIGSHNAASIEGTSHEPDGPTWAETKTEPSDGPESTTAATGPCDSTTADASERNAPDNEEDRLTPP